MRPDSAMEPSALTNLCAPRLIAKRLADKSWTGTEAMEACVFCDIIAGRSQASVVYRNDDCITAMDICPVNEGHLLALGHFPKYGGELQIHSWLQPL